MTIYHDVIGSIGDYMVVNEPYELFKIHMKISHFKQHFIIDVKRKKIDQKMIMIWIYENMAQFKPFKSS
jgi:hypothetical protein